MDTLTSRLESPHRRFVVFVALGRGKKAILHGTKGIFAPDQLDLGRN